MILCRKVNRRKWEGWQDLLADEIPADGVTYDLRTTRNRLSFWKCSDSSKSEIEQIALALAAGQDHLDKIEIAWINSSVPKEAGITVIECPGNTPIADLRTRHVDLAALDLRRLGKLARCVVDALGQEQHTVLSKVDVAHLLVKAIEDKRVLLASLHKKLQVDVQKFSTWR